MVVPALRFAVAAFIALSFAAPSQAQPVMHRTAVAAGDAIPTGGSFSVRFPTAFNDAEMKVADATAPTLVVHLLSGISSEGIRFSATETPIPGPPLPIDGFMESAANRPGAVISDVSHEDHDGRSILSFSLTEPKGGSYFRLIRINAIQYMLVVQFPEALRDRATTMKGEYFTSFKILKS
jgi:hypothetical protein